MKPDLDTMPMPTNQLTEREEAIASRAAELAVAKMTNQFFQEVGRTVVSRWLIIIGGMTVAYFFGKGWILPSLFK